VHQLLAQNSAGFACLLLVTERDRLDQLAHVGRFAEGMVELRPFHLVEAPDP
jgi:hypothetical protein